MPKSESSNDTSSCSKKRKTPPTDVAPTDRVTRHRGMAKPFQGEIIEDGPTTNSRLREQAAMAKETTLALELTTRQLPTPTVSPASDDDDEDVDPGKHPKIWDELWSRPFSFQQPPGTGLGILKKHDPIPLYDIKRINCRYIDPQSGWTVWHKEPSILWMSPTKAATKPWDRPKRKDYRVAV
ncbi:MAG: hypothetical protein Q9218_007403 [Villophora microphyllina]